ncbi:MAG: hypothetical protein LBC72_01700 [Spirochaetaceae bacterium]|nr:hypothetical protein [Spirochaetaceae bacterium]
MPAGASAGGHRAFRSNLFACGKKYFRFNRIALFKNGLRAVFEHGVLRSKTPHLANSRHPWRRIHKQNGFAVLRRHPWRRLRAVFEHGVLRSKTPRMYANYNEYRAIISVIRVHSRNSRFKSDLISVAVTGQIF